MRSRRITGDDYHGERSSQGRRLRVVVNLDETQLKLSKGPGKTNRE